MEPTAYGGGSRANPLCRWIPRMIPTRYKAKLPSALSYPVGAQVVSDSLQGVPQESALTLGFYNRPTIFASDFQKIRETNASYPILSATFRHIQPGLIGSNRDIERGFYDENWEVSVYPVPRERKAAARQALVTEGLHQLKKWLAAKRAPSWKQGRKHYEVLFSESDGKVIVRESGAA